MAGGRPLTRRNDFDSSFSGVAYPFAILLFAKGGSLFASPCTTTAINPSSATIQSSILPIPCKSLSPSRLPCYPLPCIPYRIPEPSFLSALPNLSTFQRSNVPTIFDLISPKSSHPRPLLSRQQSASVNPLTATLMKSLATVVSKRLTAKLNPLDATLTKNRGVRPRLAPWGPQVGKAAEPSTHRGNGPSLCGSRKITLRSGVSGSPRARGQAWRWWS
jgi:hypothetical protein